MMGGVHEILVSAYTIRLISMCLKNVFFKRNPTRFRNVVIKSPQPGTVVRPTFFRPSFKRRPRYAFYYIIIYYAGQVSKHIYTYFRPSLLFLPSSSLPCLIGIIYLYIILHDRADRSSSWSYQRQWDNFFLLFNEDNNFPVSIILYIYIYVYVWLYLWCTAHTGCTKCLIFWENN